MTAGPVQTEAETQILNALFRAGPQNDDRGGQFVRDDFGNIVDGLRIETDGKVPFATFTGHGGHIRLQLAGNRGVFGDAMRFVVAKPFGVLPNRLDSPGMIVPVGFGHELHIRRHQEEA